MIFESRRIYYVVRIYESWRDDMISQYGTSVVAIRCLMDDESINRVMTLWDDTKYDHIH